MHYSKPPLYIDVVSDAQQWLAYVNMWLKYWVVIVTNRSGVLLIASPVMMAFTAGLQRIAVPSSSAFSVRLRPVQKSIYFPLWLFNEINRVSQREANLFQMLYIGYYDTLTTDNHQLPSLPKVHTEKRKKDPDKSKQQNNFNRQIIFIPDGRIVEIRLGRKKLKKIIFCGWNGTRPLFQSKTSSSRTLDRIVKHKVGAPARCMYNSCRGRTEGLCCDWHCAMLHSMRLHLQLARIVLHLSVPSRRSVRTDQNLNDFSDEHLQLDLCIGGDCCGRV